MKYISKRRMLQLVSMLLVIIMTVALSAPLQASAEENLYLAYKYTGYGQKVVELRHDWQKESYKATQILMNVGDRTELCFINATLWKNAKWESSNTKVATVDANGVVKAVGDGIAEVKLTYSKRLTNRKVSATAKVCVGEKNWGITIGATELLSTCETIEMKVGGDLSFGLYGFPHLGQTELYNIIWESSDDKAATFIGNQLHAKKAGTVTVTATLVNSAMRSVIKKRVTVNITNPVYAKGAEWDNEYYRMYGENYKRLFSSAFLNINYETERDLIDSAWEVLRGEQKNIDFAALVTITNISEMLGTGIKGMRQGKDYARKENRLEAIQYLLQEMKTDETTSQQYAEDVKKALEDANGIIADVADLDDLTGAAKELEKVELNISTQEKQELLEFLKGEVTDGVKAVVSEGITASEYMITTLCLYSADNKFLDDLQTASAGGDLYKDIELLKKEREKDPVSWYKEKYFGDVAARSISKLLLETAGKKAFGKLDALHDVLQAQAEFAGIADLSQTVKATYLMSYLTDVIENIGTLRNEIKENFKSYSDQELVTKIEEYEVTYNTYINMIVPVLNAIRELEKNGVNEEISKDTRIIDSDKFDYNRHITTAMVAYMHAEPDANPTEKVKPIVSPTNVSSPTPTPIITILPTPSPTPTNTPSPSPTPTNTPSPTPTNTPSPTPTNTPSPTPTNTPSPTPTVTKVYGTLDLSGTDYGGMNVMNNANLEGDRENLVGNIRKGARLEVLDEIINTSGKRIYKIYSFDLAAVGYISARYVRVDDNQHASLANIVEGIYAIHPKCAPNSSLDVADWNAENGANLQIWETTKLESNQLFRIKKENVYYVLQSEFSQKMIDVSGAVFESQNNVQLYEANGSDAQKWIITDVGNGYYMIIPYGNQNLALDVSGGVNTNGANIWLYEKNYGDAQLFRLERYYGENAQLSDEEIQSRMQELERRLLNACQGVGGNASATKPYFTTTGKALTADRDPKCYNVNVVSQEWFKREFGTVDVSLFPAHLAEVNGSIDQAGYSCFGFANFAQWYIYQRSNLDKVTSKCVAEGTYSEQFLKSTLRPGDVIRIYITKNGTSYYHSMVFHSFSASGINVLDSNFYIDNRVRLGEVRFDHSGWGGDRVFIYRVE